MKRRLHDTQASLAEILDGAGLARAVIETTPECVTIVSADRVLAFMNAAGLAMIDASAADAAIGRDMLDLIAPEHRDSWAANHARVCAGERLTWEFDIVGLRGARRHMETHAAPLTLPDGSVAQLAVTRDITRRKQDERTLSNSDQHLRDVLEALPMAIYTTDAAGRVTFFNQAAIDMVGHHPQLGDPWCVTWRLQHPDGTPMPHDQCPMAIALREDRPVRGVEAVAERPDGGLVPFRPHPTPLHDTSGTLVGAVNMLVDLTEQKAAESRQRQFVADLKQFNDTLEERIAERTQQMAEALTQLRESEHRFRMLVDSVVDYAIFSLDPTGIVTNWNVGAQRMKGYRAEEIIGQHFSRFYTPEDLSAGVPERALATAASSGKFEAEGWRLRQDGGRFWANVVINAIRDADGSLLGFAKVTRDMTERHAVEERLRHAQKMEAIGQLTGGVAHDFNNLLAAVVGNLELVERKASPEIRRYASGALRAAGRGASLVSQLLTFSRKQPLQLTSVSLNDLIGSISDMLLRTLGVSVRVELALGQDLWPAHIDPDQTASAILNLAINARDAMPNGGTLTIETANLRVGRVNGRGGLEPGDYVVASVSDTGIGMTDDVKAKAFDPFFTTKDVGRGSGLGLSQVYGLARQSGGGVEIESSLGKGTTVHLFLRRATEAARPSGLALARADLGAAPCGARILLVDDDLQVREFMATCLGELGYAVTEADGAQAAGAAIAAGLAVDLVIMDFAMPKMHGADCARLIWSRRPGLPILFITGHFDPAALGADVAPEAHVLRKPFAIDELAARIRAMIDPRTPAQPNNVVTLRRS